MITHYRLQGKERTESEVRQEVQRIQEQVDRKRN